MDEKWNWIGVSMTVSDSVQSKVRKDDATRGPWFEYLIREFRMRCGWLRLPHPDFRQEGNFRAWVPRHVKWSETVCPNFLQNVGTTTWNRHLVGYWSPHFIHFGRNRAWRRKSGCNCLNFSRWQSSLSSTSFSYQWPSVASSFHFSEK